jgi:hypothetical protein
VLCKYFDANVCSVVRKVAWPKFRPGPDVEVGLDLDIRPRDQQLWPATFSYTLDERAYKYLHQLYAVNNWDVMIAASSYGQTIHKRDMSASV